MDFFNTCKPHVVCFIQWLSHAHDELSKDFGDHRRRTNRLDKVAQSILQQPRNITDDQFMFGIMSYIDDE